MNMVSRRAIVWCAVLALLLATVPANAVTIKIAHWMGDLASPPLMEAIRAKLEPMGIYVEEVITDPDSYRDKVLVQVLGGVGPDVIMESPYQYPLQTAGIFRDLTPYLSNDADVNFDVFIPSVWDMYTYWGGTWLVPAGVSPYLLHFNKQHFDEAGLPYPDETWHWDTEVVDAARKLKEVSPEGDVLRWGLLLENRPWTLVFSNGGNILNAAGTEAVLNDPAVVDIAGEVQSWLQQGLIPPAGDHRGNFRRGLGAMHAVMGTFAWRSYARENIDWGITYVPLGKGGERWIDENTIGWGISLATEHPEEAWEVLKAIVSVSGVITMDSLIHFPPMIGKFDADTVRFAQDAYGRTEQELAIAMDSINYVRPTLRHEKGAELMSVATAAIRSAMFDTSKAPSSVLSDANDRLNAILNQ